MMNAPGWAVELLGDTFDLDDFRKMLPPPFDPWIENYQTFDGVMIPVLRSKKWSTGDPAETILRNAHRILRLLNGEALLFDNDAQPVTHGDPVRFNADGERKTIIFARAASIQLKIGRVRLDFKSGSQPASPPAETSAQKWLREAEADDTRAELFAHLSRADNWYDLYKVAELIRRLAGNGGKLKSILGAEEAEWGRVWQTANCYRHAPDLKKYPLPKPPATFSESRALVIKVAPRVL